jgi:hypothetical protein
MAENAAHANSWPATFGHWPVLLSLWYALHLHKLSFTRPHLSVSLERLSSRIEIDVDCIFRTGERRQSAQSHRLPCEELVHRMAVDAVELRISRNPGATSGSINQVILMEVRLMSPDGFRVDPKKRSDLVI